MKRYMPAISAILAVLCGMGGLASATDDGRTYLPAGTMIQVRIIEDLTSAKAQPGDTFHGTLSEPLEVNGRQVYPKGADVLGRVMGAHASGRLSDPGVLSLEITQISYAGRTTPVHVTPFEIKGESHTKSNVTKIGGGAALGAVIGAIAGGGKGAAIGAGVGGAAGTGAAAATGKKEATVESEAILSFTVAEGSPAAASIEAPPAPEPVRTSADKPNNAARQFSLRDQRIIRNCLSQNSTSSNPAALERSDMTSDEQLQTGHILTPGLQKRVQPLPEACETQLEPLPRDLERVVYRRRVMLLDANSRIVDSFNLDASQ